MTASTRLSALSVGLEMRSHHPAGRASVKHLQNIRCFIEGLAEEAGLEDPESFARSWHLLMRGAIVSAAEGDAEAAGRAKTMAHDLLQRHRPQAPLTSG